MNRLRPLHVTRVPNTLIDISDVLELSNKTSIDQVVLLTPSQHLTDRNAMEPIGNRSRIVAGETIGATTIHRGRVGIVGVMLPKKRRTIEKLASSGTDDIKGILTSGDATLHLVLRYGVLSRLVGTLGNSGNGIHS
jgi:hypothetical protein